MSTNTAAMQCVAAVQATKAEIQVPEVLTQPGLPALALGALSAGGERKHDVVARIEPPDTLSSLLNDSGALMSKNGRLIRWLPVLMHAYISVADAHGDDTHQDLIVTRTLKLQESEL
jgi:hypothetical protein